MSLPVRYSPSGAVIATFDAGARLRLAEASSTMGGSLAVPAVADVISPNGFGDPAALVLTLALPKEANVYRAEMLLDVVNTSTNVESEVVLYLDTSVDGGTVWTNRAKVGHLVEPNDNANSTAAVARSVQVNLNMISGGSLGVDDSVPTANLKVRARANQSVGTAGTLLVSAAATSGAVTGLDGSIHFQFEECFGQ